MKQVPLTRFPKGSIRELWVISFPLMISTLASLLMLFTDRIFLAHYSTAALNASANAGTLAWALMAGMGMITAMSEVFVAQYNGAGQFERIGKPVWQMIWFSLFSYLFFIPMALWASPLIFGNGPYANLESEYFQWLMLFAPSYALLTAFSGFFIGRGKTKLMIVLAIVANVLNIVLDWALIFGIDPWIPELGIRGAAIATCFGYFLQAAVLAFLFLQKKMRTSFGTAQFQLDLREMGKCLKVGVPQGIFCALEIFGWAVFYWMMTSLSEMHITISTICQSFAILFSFFHDGLSRGATAIAGNFLGAKEHFRVFKVLRSSMALFSFFAMALALILVFDPLEAAKLLFFETGKQATLSVEFQNSLTLCMNFAFAYLFFDGIRWIFSGILVAAGDTLFLLITGSFSIWFFLLLPLYLIVVRNELTVEYAWILSFAYAVLFAFVYAYRFFQGKWKKIDLVESDEKEETQETSAAQRNP